jgi:hypothetical protein
MLPFKGGPVSECYLLIDGIYEPCYLLMGGIIGQVSPIDGWDHWSNITF